MKALPTRRTLEALRTFPPADPRDYLLFWGHTPKRPGTIDQSCLSNWYPASFELAGQAYATSEHYMMAEKARLFGDDESLRAILAAATPGEAKKLGREVKGFQGECWEERRSEIVVHGCAAKFGQNAELGSFLLATGERVLVEASPYDRIWGIGLPAGAPDALVPGKWRGLNLLGFALMEVRERLRSAA